MRFIHDDDMLISTLFTSITTQLNVGLHSRGSCLFSTACSLSTSSSSAFFLQYGVWQVRQSAQKNRQDYLVTTLNLWPQCERKSVFLSWDCFGNGKKIVALADVFVYNDRHSDAVFSSDIRTCRVRWHLYFNIFANFRSLLNLYSILFFVEPSYWNAIVVKFHSHRSFGRNLSIHRNMMKLRFIVTFQI